MCLLGKQNIFLKRYKLHIVSCSISSFLSKMTFVFTMHMHYDWTNICQEKGELEDKV